MASMIDQHVGTLMLTFRQSENDTKAIEFPVAFLVAADEATKREWLDHAWADYFEPAVKSLLRLT